MRALVIAIVILGSTGSAPPAEPHGTGGAPRHMVAFVVGDECPTGWQTDALDAGRVMIGTADVAAVGRTVGTPLAAAEDRTHGHGVAGATMALPYKSISAGDGSNNQGAAAGDQPVTGSVDAATSGLPFVQLTACVSP
jgi:hypothetical protein